MTNIQVVKIIDLRLHCRCLRIVQSYSPDGCNVHPMQYMFPSIHTSLPSKCISICSSFSRDSSVCLAEIAEHVICVAIGRIYILWPTSGRGVVLKKKWGRLKQDLDKHFFKQFRPRYTYTHTRQKNCHSGSLVLSCDTARPTQFQ